jgi:hypothetical protein
MPIILLMISLVGAHRASAHSAEALSSSSSYGEELSSSQNVQTASVISTVQRNAPCECPGGHCTSGMGCLAMCAAAAVYVDTVAFELSPTRLVIVPSEMKFHRGLAPSPDLDPPRSTA